MKKIMQSTSLTCFTTCLLYVLSELKNIEFNKDLELEIFFYALNFFRKNYILGHLDYVTKKYKIEAEWYAEIEKYVTSLKKVNKNRNIKINYGEISLDFIDKFLKNKFKPIVYVDWYIVTNVYHYPHFIVIDKKKRKYHVFDPWYGKIILISPEKLHEGIRNLRTMFWITPQIIVLKPCSYS